MRSGPRSRDLLSPPLRPRCRRCCCSPRSSVRTRSQPRSSSRSATARRCRRRSCSCRCCLRSRRPWSPWPWPQGSCWGRFPRSLRGRFHRERLAAVVLNAWHSVGAAAVFALAGAPEPSMDALPVLAVALAAQFALEFVTTAVREALAVGAPVAALVRAYRWVFAVDAMLTPLGFLAAIGSVVWAGGFLFAVPAAPADPRLRAGTERADRQCARAFARLSRYGIPARRRGRGRRCVHGQP